ncbi:uncharacterized protein LOC129908631 [Episyrphus balteatus]|uniref:uncharacterized protein LOC129908631 n=1 Tax=Episyrphus balteatus TaxID=286459 RepID=UPI002484F9DA|nr:uncharacterized protein LOC129908631 [Episyrphus balteatus]
MKLYVVFSAFLAVTSASQVFLTPAGPYISNQYHSQDGNGQYSYGYNDLLSNKEEVKLMDGTTRGSYSYIDSNNIVQKVNYIADANGFRVTSATNLPKPVEAPIFSAQDLPQQIPDTFEVAAAKSAHFAAIEEAKQRLTGAQQIVPVAIGLPQQVQDTPKVAKAKAEHLAAIEAAKNQGITIIGLPQQVEDTLEVSKAKAEHLSAIEKAKLRNIGASSSNIVASNNNNNAPYYYYYLYYYYY